MSLPPIHVKVVEAAEMTRVSEATIKKAIRTTNPDAFPPPLPAHRNDKGHLFVFVSDLHAWLNRWPAA